MLGLLIGSTLGKAVKLVKSITGGDGGSSNTVTQTSKPSINVTVHAPTPKRTVENKDTIRVEPKPAPEPAPKQQGKGWWLIFTDFTKPFAKTFWGLIIIIVVGVLFLK